MTRFTTLCDVRESIFKGSLTLAEQLQGYLKRIGETSDLNAYIEVWEDEAMSRAHALDAEFKSGKRMGKLYGAVFSIKSNICYQGHIVSASSQILKGYVSPFNSTVVERILAEDGVIIGSTNCDEFGMGSASTYSAYGPVLNGQDSRLIAGGSSGGAAVSIQVDSCLFALGSDTGGSIRQPAAMCGVSGFKPSYGKVSRHGLLAYASSFDQIGIITKDVEGLRTVMDVIAGKDKSDSTSFDFPKMDELPLNATYRYACFSGLEKNNLDYVNDTVQIIREKFDEALTFVEFKYMEYLVPCYYILTTAEASSNLSRYDGVRFGYRSTSCSTPEEMYRNSRTEGFGMEVKKRIMLGTFVLSEGYFDAYYTQAQRIRSLMVNEINNILDNYDVIVLPVTTSGPWLVDQKTKDPNEIYLSDVFTVLASLTGMPAISIPISTKNGEYKNVQLIMKQGEDEKLLALVKRWME